MCVRSCSVYMLFICVYAPHSPVKHKNKPHVSELLEATEGGCRVHALSERERGERRKEKVRARER